MQCTIRPVSIRSERWPQPRAASVRDNQGRSSPKNTCGSQHIHQSRWKGFITQAKPWILLIRRSRNVCILSIDFLFRLRCPQNIFCMNESVREWMREHCKEIQEFERGRKNPNPAPVTQPIQSSRHVQWRSQVSQWCRVPLLATRTAGLLGVAQKSMRNGGAAKPPNLAFLFDPIFFFFGF